MSSHLAKFLVPPLLGAAAQLESFDSPPSPEVLRQIASNVRSAAEQLRKPDPYHERMEFALLAFCRSSEPPEPDPFGVIGDKPLRVIDAELHNWAAHEIHRLRGWEPPTPANGTRQ
jgi:hypothetical protein